MPRYLLALDQGTTSSRAVLFDAEGAVVAIERQEYTQIYPQPGWVEHNPEEIWFSQLSTVARVLHTAEIRPNDIAAIGITNQRETTILWDRKTGEPVANAIVWQDRRTARFCEELRADGAEEIVRHTTGLTLDPYFSATKLRWLLDSTAGLRARAERGDIAFGTVDCWLLWRLTKGRVHCTDSTNASRTLLYNLESGSWDDEMLHLFGVPAAMLPEIRPSSHVYGASDRDILGAEIPIAGVAGDQHAALFGQTCFDAGMTKNTYGTGSFLLMNTGAGFRASKHGLISTMAWDLGASRARNFALEGSVFVTGAAVQWLRDELQIIRSSDEIEPLAASVADTGGVYFVPAFAGLGAPYWDAEARGALLGLSRGTGRAQIARAALEAACHQSCDVLEAMRADSELAIPELRVDGGMTVNDTLLQMQADLLGAPVVRPTVTETTALGAAFLAGLATGIWKSTDDIRGQWKRQRTFEPIISSDERDARRQGWLEAVGRVRSTGQ